MKDKSEFRKYFQVTIPLKRLVSYREISENHLHFFGPVNFYTSSSVAAQDILISSVDFRTLFALTRESPHWRQATIRTFRFNELNPERLS